jgi:ketosteroid isomerase-like protein
VAPTADAQATPGRCGSGSATWKDFSLTAEEFYEADDRVVVPFRVRARGIGSGVEVERRWAHTWTMRAGKAVRFEVNLDPDIALAQLGAGEG